MRGLFFVLLLINLLVAGWAILTRAPQQGADWKSREFHPEKVRLLGSNDNALKSSPSLAAKPAEAAAGKEPQQCLVWAGIAETELVEARRLLTELKARVTVREAKGEDRPRYWVYLPPVNSTPEAEKRITKLREQGLSGSDYFVVRDPGPLRNAISLGVFSTQEAARFRLADLKDKGVSGAEVGQRDTVKVSEFWVFDAADATRDELTRVAAKIRSSEIIKRECPAVNQ